MRQRSRVLMTCVVVILSITNLAVSIEVVNAMPESKVQVVCDVAIATFPKGCSKTKLNEIKKSAALEYIALLENTVEARCIFWYRSRQESIDQVRADLSANYPEVQLSADKLTSNSRDANDWSGASAYSLDVMEEDYMWPGYEDLVQKYLLDQRSKSKPYWEIRDQFTLDWNARLIERAPMIWSQIKKAADTYNTTSSALTKISSDAAVATRAKQKKKDAADVAKRENNAAVANAQLAANRAAALIAANKKIKASGGCQKGNSTSWTENGYSWNFSEGTRICIKGKWGKPLNTAPSGNGSGSNSTKRTLVNKTCDLKATAMSSSFSGQNYSWTIWNNWSDGSRTVASMGSGYANAVPNGC